MGSYDSSQSLESEPWLCLPWEEILQISNVMRLDTHATTNLYINAATDFLVVVVPPSISCRVSQLVCTFPRSNQGCLISNCISLEPWVSLLYLQFHPTLHRCKPLMSLTAFGAPTNLWVLNSTGPPVGYLSRSYYCQHLDSRSSWAYCLTGDYLARYRFKPVSSIFTRSFFADWQSSQDIYSQSFAEGILWFYLLPMTEY